MRVFAVVECVEALECVHERVRMAGASTGNSRLQEFDEVDEVQVRCQGVGVICIGKLIAGEG
jgi:hypothetical protein